MKNPLFARYFNRFAARREERGNRELRQELLSGLSGRVIKASTGNGLNFAHYPGAVREVVAVEPEPYLRDAAAFSPVAPRIIGMARKAETPSGRLSGDHPTAG